MIRRTVARTALVGAIVWAAAQTAGAQQPQAVSEQAKKINELIAAGWAKAEIKKPSGKADDFEFLRRAYIDLIGRVATPEEVRDFEEDRGANKRVRLIQRLLTETKFTPKNGGRPALPAMAGGKPLDYTAEFAEHWANLWTVWLMTRTGNDLYREQMRVWLEIQFTNNTNHKDMVTQLLTAKGKSNDNGAVNFIIHHLGDPVPADERGKYGFFDAVPITSRVTKLFIGLQTQCTQCHDHPFNKEWVQSDFWGVNAFFRQTLRDRTPTAAPGAGNRMMEAQQVTLSDDSGANPIGKVLYERRDGRRLASPPLFLKDLAQAEKGETSDKVLPAGKTRRQALAEFVVSHDNFAKAYVNRIWGHLFGRGLNKDATIDDFGSHNEVVHPELLAFLAEEFVKYGYDQKKLLEWICTSDVYQLSHVAQKESVDPKFDAYFARMPLKALSPEVMFESLMVATKAEARGDADTRKRQRDQWMSKLVRNFGDDEGNELSFNGTVVQALLMMNGRELNDEVAGTGGVRIMAKGPNPKGPNPKANVSRENVVASVMIRKGANPKAIYDELFLMALNRHPTSIEETKLEQVRNGAARVSVGAAPAPTPKGGVPKGPAPKSTTLAPGAAPSDVTFYQDVLWALLNTNEFMLNH